MTAPKGMATSAVGSNDSSEIGGQFDLTLTVRPDAEGGRAVLDYAADLFDAATVERMSEHLRVLLDAVAADPDAPLSRLPLMDDAEQRAQTQFWLRAWRRAGQERFGRVMGVQVGRLLVMLATAALGSTTNLLMKGPGLPGYAQATSMARTQLGLGLLAVGAHLGSAALVAAIAFLTGERQVGIGLETAKAYDHRRPGDAGRCEARPISRADTSRDSAAPFRRSCARVA